MTRDSGLDLSKMYGHSRTETKTTSQSSASDTRTSSRRSRRAVSEDRSVEVGIGWRGTGGRATSVSRQASNSSLAGPEGGRGSFRFLPPESLNQEDPPKLILKRTPAGGSRVSLYGNDDDAGDGGNRKKLSSGCQAGDIARREAEMGELITKLDTISQLINKVELAAEKLLKRQTESEEFQSQMKQELEGYDLQKGVFRVLDSVEYDRREHARLLKKVTEMQKRHSQGIFLDGENEELRSLTMGANDLEKKLHRALEELERLSGKTEALIDRQKKILEERRRRMEEEAQKNASLMALLKDATTIDKMLKDLAHVRSEHMKAQHIHRKIQEKVQNLDEDEMDTDEIVLERIGVDTQTVTDDLLRIRDDIHKLQDAAIDNLNDDVEIDVVTESENLKQRMGSCKDCVEQLKIDIEEFLQSQNKRFSEFMKKLREEEEEAERLRREEEERLRLLEEEEERKTKLADMKAKELSLLELEAEENRMKQRQEMLHMLDGDMIELHKMKDKVLVLVDKQKKIKGVRQKRRELYTIREEEETENDSDIKTLMNKTSRLFSFLADDENKVITLKGKVASMNPDEVSDEVKDIENDIINKSKQIQEISEETDILYDKEQKLLDDAQRMKESNDDQQRATAMSKLQNCQKKFEKMDRYIKLLVGKQEEAGKIVDDLRNVDLQQHLDELKDKTKSFEETFSAIEDRLTSSIKSSESDQSLIQSVEKILNDLDANENILENLHLETDGLTKKCQKFLYEKHKQDEEEERMKLRKDQDKLDSLQQTAKTVATKQNDLEATLKADNDEDEDEKRKRLKDLENLLK